MKPLTPIGSPSPLRLLNKGPDYLRRQMDPGSRSPSVSAVERLEADKAKYVKTQQVINTKQEPALAPCATPPPRPRRNLAIPPTSTPILTRRPPTGSRPVPPVPSSPSNDNEDDARKENLRTPCIVIEARNRNNVGWILPPSDAVPIAPHSAPLLRRSTGKRMLRPDSLVIYRQKKECKSPSSSGIESANGEVKGYGFVRRLFQGSVRERNGRHDVKTMISEEKGSSRDGDSRMSWSNGSETQRSSRTESLNSSVPTHSATGTTNVANEGNINDMDPWRPVATFLRPTLRRSESDLRLRVSVALSEQERFFDFCGLDRDMVDRLGPENFLTGASSVDTLSLVLRSVGSEPSEFSRHSGEGLFQEEVAEQVSSSGVSIVERNARVIKWLYGCKNAAQEEPRAPKESTV